MLGTWFHFIIILLCVFVMLDANVAKESVFQVPPTTQYRQTVPSPALILCMSLRCFGNFGTIYAMVYLDMHH